MNNLIKAKIQVRTEEVRGCSSEPWADYYHHEAVIPLDNFDQLEEQIRKAIDNKFSHGWVSDGKRPYLAVAKCVLTSLGIRKQKKLSPSAR